MSDIAKCTHDACTHDACPRKEQCYRYTAPAIAERDQLRAELAEAKLDAERYRRLCSLVAWGNFGVCRVQSNEEGDDYADDGDMLDAWLDDPEMIAEARGINAAMAGGENGN